MCIRDSSFPATPSICLSANVEDALFCSEPRDDSIFGSRNTAERAAAKEHGAAFLDLNDSLCDPTTCGMIIGSTLVYRDPHHMTATFAAGLAPVLWGRLKTLLQ